MARKVNKTLAAITTRAKSIRGKNKNIAWIAAVKKASSQLRSEGKIGKAKKKSSRQTGTSKTSVDRRIKAKPPGKRTVRHGKKKTTSYNERRKNRSDKPGSLTGIKQTAKAQLGKALLAYEMATTVKATKIAAKQKTKWRKVLRAL